MNSLRAFDAWVVYQRVDRYQRPLLKQDGQTALGARGFHAQLVHQEPKYLEHQCSEISDALGHWAPVSGSGEWGSGRRPNHWWDTAYMQFALTDIVRTHLSAPRRRTFPVPQPYKPPIDYAMM